MILYYLLLIPVIAIFFISTRRSYSIIRLETGDKVFDENNNMKIIEKKQNNNKNFYKKIAFIASILNLIISLIIYILFDFSNNQFQFIQEHYDLSFYDIYLGVDGISIYFVLLTTIIMPIALVSN